MELIEYLNRATIDNSAESALGFTPLSANCLASLGNFDYAQTVNSRQIFHSHFWQHFTNFFIP
jgi:hypothetical protein